MTSRYDAAKLDGQNERPTLPRLFVPISFPPLTELRAIGRRYLGSSHDLGSAWDAPRSQVDLSDLIATRFQDVDDVHQRLTDLESRLREANDRRAVFLTVYAKMTASVSDAIERGVFTDTDWIRRYTIVFADYYRRALLASERDQTDKVPRPWQIAFGASTRGQTIILQDALLGINAHINYDLAYAIHDVGIDPDRPTKRADHNAINDILRRLIDDAQDALVDIYRSDTIARLDDLLGRSDERLAHLGLVSSRDLAWHNAEGLTDRRLPPLRSFVRWRLTSVSTGAAHIIAHLPSDPDLIQHVRRLEDEISPIQSFRDAFLARAG